MIQRYSSSKFLPKRRSLIGSINSWFGIGRCRGGFTAKIHTTCNNKGKPLRFILTGGEVADCLKAEELFDNFDAKKVEAVLADKGYDADYIVAAIDTKLRSKSG